MGGLLMYANMESCSLKLLNIYFACLGASKNYVKKCKIQW